MARTGQLDWTDFYIFSILDLHVSRAMSGGMAEKPEYFITEYQIYHVMSIL
jgi:hypothetical protein